MDSLIESSRRSARVTHYDPLAQSSCVILNVWISELIMHRNQDGCQHAVNSLMDIDRGPWLRLMKIADIPEAEISSGGYTVHTLESAAWSFLTTASFEEAVVRAANLGDDADTVAAVCGALSGSYYGYSAIPARWRASLKDEKRISQIALALGSEESKMKL
jgi:ADP-ribosylglycohydrolase